MPTHSANDRQARLQRLHDALTEDLVRFEANLPKQAEDMSEAVERYARVISLLIRSVNLLAQRQDTDSDKGEQPAREDIIAELERAFHRIFAGDDKAKISGESDRPAS